MDKLTLARAQLLHPIIRDTVISTLEGLKLPPGVQVRITQSLRTFAEQDKLYAQGRSAPGQKVTNARGGESLHNFGLAFDFVLLINGQVSWTVDENWKKVAAVFKEQGFSWGGEWKSIKDYPHLEKSFGYSWQQLLDKYRKGEFISGTQYVRL
ncbi:M15 family metallopeptidase [Chitinophaga polysaccharea]|uniref:M15 family metallopeptidase n=1 Tax=Chitinophaga polysaccharea TaxID=1293035 RepID=UPI001455B8CC|nr:M15 family metallopeptidase [Chitinophaga polysaccharea]NLR60688.1 M15 family metallopeptidase [Chitinophaga polysaccharea]